MTGFMNKYAAAVSGLLMSCVLLQAEHIKTASLKLKGNAKVVKDVLVLDGRNSYAEIPGTEKYNLSQQSLTFACSVKLNKRPAGTRECLASFFSKPGTPFLFARYNDRLASNLRNTQNKVAAKTRADKVPKEGVWHHVAVTYTFFDDPAHGERGYKTALYLDGEKLEQETHGFLQV